MENARFPKSERLVSQKLIDQLFTGGHSHSTTAFPLRAVYYLPQISNLRSAEGRLLPEGRKKSQTTNLKPQILISVPKKHFKHAVDRNRVKRQIREAYRHNKQQLSEAVAKGQQLNIAFVWMSSKHQPTAIVEARVVTLLKKIAEACM